MKKIKGFTLVEMLIVITIIGVLMSLTIIEYGKFVEKSEQTVFEEEFRQIISVVDIAIASREVRTTEGLLVLDYGDFTLGTELEAIYNAQFDPDLPVGSITITDNIISYRVDGLEANFNYETREFE